MRDAQREPIAIVGIGCRFPKAENPQAFWRLLHEGQSAIREVPNDRWKPDVASVSDHDPTEKAASRWGGFLDSIDTFDSHAFRMLSREIKFMDPQQRLLLEVTWEAFEDAGLPFQQIAGSRTGVFMGVLWHDYLQLQMRNWSHLDGYTATGNPSGFAASRLSYFFDLKGPSFAIDAGCTSSLTSVYLACQSLWSGESDMALAGGVNLMLSPGTMILVAKTGMLSPDGSCRVLDAQADGVVRGEGAGVVVLKPLSQVQPSDQVYALIRGIASNHNGHGAWMTATSETTQKMLLQDAYRQANVDPSQVSYVELQGASFLRGDAIEIKALEDVLGASPQRTHPCLVGSVKTNIGHLEAAAGIASLIKVALALHHREIPPTLNLETVNPAIPFSEIHLMAQRKHGPWPASNAPLLAGVTTLSLTGTNAHAVLEAFPHIHSKDDSTASQQRILPLSARSLPALRAQLASMRDFLRLHAQSNEIRWSDICYTATVRRTHHEFRGGVVADSPLQAANALDKLLESSLADPLVPSAQTKNKPHRLVFLLAHYSAHWSQSDMAVLLREPAAQNVIDTCKLALTAITKQAFFTEADPAALLSLKQPSNRPIISFMFQCALAAVWRSWGIIPEAIVGEGAGEVAAAYIKGTLSLEKALQTILSDTREETTPNPAIPALDQLLDDGYDVFLSPGPPFALPEVILARLPYHERQVIMLASLGANEEPVLCETLLKLYTLGFPVNWSAMYTNEEKCVSLPTYCWQRKRFWLADLDVEGISIPPERQADSQQKQPLSDSHLSHAAIGANASTEEVLTSLWGEVLGLDTVNPQDNFFELGGHSLLAGQLLRRIQHLFQVKITLENLFQFPTPASCAGLIPGDKIIYADGKTSLEELPPLVSNPTERYQPFPVTDVQQAYWMGRKAIFELGNVGNHGYIEVEAIDFHLERIEPIVRRLIERHEMLRAVMLPDGQQCVLEQVPPFEVEIEDLQALPAPQQEQRLLEVRQEMDHELFSLEIWPAFRIRASLLSAQLVRLHLSIESLFIDAWSIHILIQDFIQLYWNAEAELPALEVSFRDYVLAEQHIQERESFQSARAYWSQRLATLPPAPELPLVHALPSLSSSRFVHYEGRLEAARWQVLKARGARVGLTPSGILLAAFAEVLAAWSKTTLFSINLTLFRRLPLHTQINALVGDFTSLVPLEVDCQLERSFAERAQLLQKQLWRDLDHSDYSGIRVLRDLARTQGDITRALLPVVFTSLLVQDITSPYQTPWHKTIYSIAQTPQVRLDHQVLEQQGNLVFHWQVVEDLFPAGLIPALFDAYCQFLSRLIDTDRAWLEPVRDLLPAHQLSIRQQRNTTSCPRPEDLCLHTLVLQQVDLRPDDLAVITPSRRLSYRELYTGATLLAQELRHSGARPDHLIAVVMEKGWEQVVGVLAILLAGAAYVPIDPALPPERLLFLLAQSEVEQILTQSRLDNTLAWPPTSKRYCVDCLDLSAPAPSRLPLVQSPGDLAYVIYTSGSTGIPKGVMIEHHSAVNTILDLNRRFSISPGDRVLALSALNFDLSVYDIFGILAAGGTIVLPEGKENTRDPQAWLDLLHNERVTLWNTVPALLQILVEYVENHPSTLSDLQLRLAYLSGDWIPPSLPERARALLPNLQVISMGGATEAAIWSIIYPVKTVEAQWTSIPYGWPMENQRWEIFNERLEPVPDWVVGQLYIGGSGLARGYWRDEAKTASKFIRHPHTGERLYHTGDLGRYWPDGTIEFLGREDFQVKIQGYRIELGEIEVALRQHPSVQEAVVVVSGTTHEAKRLLAGVLCEPGSSISPDTLLVFLQERLPGYMVPSHLFLLNTLPLTANGKVDRNALLTLAQQAAASQIRTASLEAASITTLHEEALEENSMMAQVAKLIKRILPIEHIHPSTHLLACGASSLDIFRLANLLDKELHIRVEFGQLFRLLTVEAIAKYCQTVKERLEQVEEATRQAAQHSSTTEYEEGDL